MKQSGSIPRGSYPTPVLGYLIFYIADPNHKTRYPKKGVGYEPLGKAWRLVPEMSFSFVRLNKTLDARGLREVIGLR